MIKKSIVIIAFFVVPLFAPQPKQKVSVSLIKYLLDQPNLKFTKKEREDLQSIEAKQHNAPIWLLPFMKHDIDVILKDQIGKAQYPNGATRFVQIDGVKKIYDHDKSINDFNRLIQKDLTLKICQQLISCGKLVAYTGLLISTVLAVELTIKGME